MLTEVFLAYLGVGSVTDQTLSYYQAVFQGTIHPPFTQIWMCTSYLLYPPFYCTYSIHMSWTVICNHIPVISLPLFALFCDFTVTLLFASSEVLNKCHYICDHRGREKRWTRRRFLLSSQEWRANMMRWPQNTLQRPQYFHQLINVQFGCI